MTQASINFDAPVSVYTAHRAEVQEEADRLASAKDRVLARLRQGSATNIELNAICYRYGARLLELKREGHPWVKESEGRGVYRYMLTSGA